MGAHGPLRRPLPPQDYQPPGALWVRAACRVHQPHRRTGCCHARVGLALAQRDLQDQCFWEGAHDWKCGDYAILWALQEDVICVCQGASEVECLQFLQRPLQWGGKEEGPTQVALADAPHGHNVGHRTQQQEAGGGRILPGNKR
jgi:hypothetical protein